MAYSNVQTSNYRKKIRSPYSLLLDDEAQRGLGTAGVKAKKSNELAERQRSEDVQMWDKDYALKLEQNKMATDAARFSMGTQFGKMGYGIMDKFGSGGYGFGKGGGSGWGGTVGNVLGGAGMGYGLGSMLGGGKYKKEAGIAGGLAGLLLDLF